jgi:hypothetical protein
VGFNCNKSTPIHDTAHRCAQLAHKPLHPRAFEEGLDGNTSTAYGRIHCWLLQSPQLQIHAALLRAAALNTSCCCCTRHQSLHDAAVDVQVQVCAAAPGPVLPHGAGHQLVPPPVMAVMVRVQRPVKRCLDVAVLAATARYNSRGKQASVSAQCHPSWGKSSLCSAASTSLCSRPLQCNKLQSRRRSRQACASALAATAQCDLP